jgi:hypothetical protein
MRRRDLLLLRTHGARIVDLPCGRLYMRFVEARSQEEAQTDADQSAATDDPRGIGEPPRAVDIPSVEALLAALDEELQSVEALRLCDRQWLAEPRFQAWIGPALDRFLSRGGRIVD